MPEYAATAVDPYLQKTALVAAETIAAFVAGD
jgi:hypothetical protein